MAQQFPAAPARGWDTALGAPRDHLAKQAREHLAKQAREHLDKPARED